MITTGWILPDMHEVTCKSCSTLNGHIEIVRRYLANLKEKDSTTYDKISNEYYHMLIKQDSLGLDDFAVIKLGWIKINNDPINILFYTQNNELEFLTEKYIKMGYHSVILESSKSIIKVDLPSKELI